ncbi:MAG: von Willebrand factor type A domain-containing protein, partial [Bacteroidales bacterium]|nr:von Willebrand factor type A domain-containing protein [Bacteroidales bacterium]
MKTKVFLPAIALLMMSYSLLAGTVSGTVTDASNGDPMPFANIKIEIDGIVINGTCTDFEGKFRVINVAAGTYDIVVNYIGYAEYRLKKIVVSESLETILEIKLEQSSEILGEVEIVDYRVPLISKDEVYCCKISNIQSTSIRGSRNNSNSYKEPNTESYAYISENGFKKSRKEPLSTFSIDVDRAAYSNVRRFINSSQMPNVDAVRIEEMINYFDYNYGTPENGEPFATHLEIGDCPWNPENKLLLIGIQGEKVSEEKIPPCNLVFLIDVSGSMSDENKLPLLKKSFKYLIDQLRPEDRVSIVVYAGAAGCVLPSTSGKNKVEIMAAIDKLQSGGSTAGGQGIVLAYDIAVKNFIEGGNNRVILATDGDFNVGVSSDSELERLIEKKRESGVYLTILGFGTGNYKDSKMEGLSNKGNGNYAYIDNILEAKKVFGKELWGTLYTIAKDVKIQIEFNPGIVKEYRLIGYENRMLENEDFNNDKKDAGEIGSGHTVTAIYELVLINDDKNSEDVDPLKYQKSEIVESSDVATLKIRYKEPDQSKSKLLTTIISKNDLNTTELSDNF